MDPEYLPPVNGNKKVINPPRYHYFCEKSILFIFLEAVGFAFMG